MKVSAKPGQGVEITWDAARTNDAERDAYYHVNVVHDFIKGVDMPQKVMAQYRNGVPEQQLLVMPEGSPSPIPEAHGMT